MHKSQRIKIDPSVENIDDRHIKFNLEENIDTLEFLTLNFSLKDAYQAFNSDYGVLVGRVIANDGIGVPNAKISVFIPLDEEDENNHEIYRIYPYKTPRDLNNEGKRYNLLPRVAKYNKESLSYKPAQPFGSFPTKEEVLTNDNVREVYKKYYKYTATTNDSGDYMIYGIPVGVQTVHLSIDVTDIGKYSMNPAAMITNLGYSSNLFSDGGRKIKPSDDLNDLPHIETQEISVDVIPFWGDNENYEIGITRQDFRVRAQLVNTFIMFGTAFTDADEFMWGRDIGGNVNADKRQSLYAPTEPVGELISMSSKRISYITEKIYYYPSDVSDEKIIGGTTDDYGNDMRILDKSEYTSYIRDGDFVFIVNCNRRKVITDEFGNEVVVSDDSPSGVFTEFRGFVTLEIDGDNLPLDWQDEINAGFLAGSYPIHPIRYRLKFPQYAERAQSHAIFRASGEVNESAASANTATWRKQHKKFNAGQFYTFSRFHGVVFDNAGGYVENDGFINTNQINYADQIPFRNVGIIAGNRYGVEDEEGDTATTVTLSQELINNVPNEEFPLFGGNWLNMAVYLPQIAYLNPTVKSNTFKNLRSNTNFTQDYRYSTNNGFSSSVNLPARRNYYWDNNEFIAAGQTNTRWFARSDLHWTDIVEVPKDDIIKMNEYEGKGFTDNDITLSGTTYRNGIYENLDWTVSGACPLGGGKENGDPSAGPDPRTYFYKGFSTANCIEYLISLGLI